LRGFVTDERRGLLDCDVLAKGCAPPPNHPAGARAAGWTAWWRSRAKAAASGRAAPERLHRRHGGGDEEWPRGA
jgi:hypothetical protein